MIVSFSSNTQIYYVITCINNSLRALVNLFFQRLKHSTTVSVMKFTAHKNIFLFVSIIYTIKN